MNKRQKIFTLAVTATILTAAVATAMYLPKTESNTGKLKVVATFYPLAFFAEQIGQEKVAVQQLIPDNTEVHNWQPSPSDILEVDDADVILYNGASLDHWFEEDLLPTIDSSNKIIVETTEGVELLETHQENGEHTHEHEHEGSYDPHTWVSPFVAKQQAQNIYEAFIEKDPDNTDYYTENWEVLQEKLEQLDNNYMTALSTKGKNQIIVAHSAFGYLAWRYSFEQHGVIGISADEQPSASAYADLVDIMVEHETYVVYVNPVYSTESAQTLKNELERLTGQDVQILTLYFMLGNMDGLDYFGQQEQNLQNLKVGLQAN
ncbi:MAG: zinc ABC transporter substrate-binding protein [Candidatus Bathyarchaeota archaeon]|nr:zinc ABC transporter substrate-binding protein [Candidatus Bathyarchaeota archaeon]